MLAAAVMRMKIMQNVATDTEVLIVGAGPVGLFLANECARRGLRWRIVEARSRQSAHSKALAIFPRTLEIFDMAELFSHPTPAGGTAAHQAYLHSRRRRSHS